MTTRRSLLVICYLLFNALGVVSPMVQAEPPKKILIFHSFHQGFEWTDQMHKGITTVLQKDAIQKKIYTEYLDAKRFPGHSHDKAFLEYLKDKYQNLAIDVIILTDNDALFFIKNFRDEVFTKIPKVFCGVVNFSDQLFVDLDNLTGVLNIVPFKATIEFMQKLQPNRKHIVVIADQSVVGQALMKAFRKAIKTFDPELVFDYWQDYNFSELRPKLTQLGKQHLIYLLAMNVDHQETYCSNEEGLNVLGKGEIVPVYSSFKPYLGKGVVGGKMVSGEQQGMEAAIICQRILKGELSRDIQLVRSVPSHLLVDSKMIKHYGIPNSAIPEEVRQLNGPTLGMDKIKLLIEELSLFEAIIFLSLLGIIIGQVYLRSKLLAKNRSLKEDVVEKKEALSDMNEKLSQRSLVDDLTKVHKRSEIIKYFEKEVKIARRYGHPLSIALIDIDHFKNINDELGQDVGDQVLKELSLIVKNEIRKIDLLGRYGGEEFMIILPHTGIENAFIMTERLRLNVQNHQFVEKHRITISGGIVQYQEEYEKELIPRLEDALEIAKKSGRNQIVKK